MSNYVRYNGKLYRAVDANEVKIVKVDTSKVGDSFTPVLSAEVEVNGVKHSVSFSIGEGGQLHNAYQYRETLSPAELKSVEAVMRSKYNKKFTSNKIDVASIEEFQKAGSLIREVQDELGALNRILQGNKTAWSPNNTNIGQVLKGYRSILPALEKFSRSSNFSKLRNTVEVALRKAEKFGLK